MVSGAANGDVIDTDFSRLAFLWPADEGDEELGWLDDSLIDSSSKEDLTCGEAKIVADSCECEVKLAEFVSVMESRLEDLFKLPERRYFLEVTSSSKELFRKMAKGCAWSDSDVREVVPEGSSKEALESCRITILPTESRVVYDRGMGGDRTGAWSNGLWASAL